ncbi:MAG: DPP IV N-terminal domain-containing protein [Flavobacteriales bacterium]
MRRIAIIMGLLLCTLVSTAQNPALTIEDAVLGYHKGLYPENMSGLAWVPSSDFYSAVNEDILYIFDSKGIIKKKLTLDELKTTIKKEDLAYMPRLTWESSDCVSFISGDKLYLVNPFKNTLKRFVDLPEDFENPDFHADSEHMAYTRGKNLSIWQNDQETRITKNDEFTTSGQAIARYEFGISKGTFWSPNGEYLAFYEKDETNVTDYPLVDYTSTPAKLAPIKYPMAGQSSEHGKVGIVNATTGKRVYLQQQGEKDSYLTNVAWGPESRFVYAAHLNREQTTMKLNKYDRTGALIKTIYEETDAEYVEPEQPPHFVPGSKTDFIWMTDKNGFNNLLLMNDEGVVKELTSFQFDVTEFLGFDEKGKTVYVHATGESATEQHGYAITIKSGQIKQLTKEPGYHTVSVGSSGKYYIDSFTSLTTPRKISVYSTKKSQGRVLLESRNPLANYTVGTTEVFSKKASDSTDLWCRMIKPSHFDETKTYPVLVYTYNGPHVQLITNTWMGGASLWMHSLAEEGYIIFTVDGRGSSHRGIDFEQAVHENMGTLEVQDQVDMVTWLKELPYTDNDRFAVHGWSYGGFMTTSLMLKHPDVFKVGVAGGPVIDWRLYEVMYTERYMDTPESNPEGFKNADLKNYVSNLEGDLLLIHGMSDDVVVMQHSTEFLQRCVEEGVQVDFFPYPGHEHNVRGRDRVHLMVKVTDYIKDKLSN